MVAILIISIRNLSANNSQSLFARIGFFDIIKLWGRKFPKDFQKHFRFESFGV